MMGPAPAAPDPHTDAAASPADPRPGWDEVAERYGPRIRKIAYQFTNDPHEAEDLTQDVFVRVLRNLDRYRPGTFDGWLYRITRNLFLNRLRRQTTVALEPLATDDADLPPSADPGPDEVVETDALSARLEAALATLPEEFRRAVVLCDVVGLSYEEIGAVTGWPLGTVRSRIHRGRRSLREVLEDADVVPEVGAGGSVSGGLQT